MKNIKRIYLSKLLYVKQIVCIEKKNIHYIRNVLRMEKNEMLEIFNDTNYIFLSEIIYMDKKIIKIQILQKKLKNLESPIYIHLGQVIPKKNKIDVSIKKTIEMGVSTITPLFSENCNIKKQTFNFLQKMKRWKEIVISSCQQCHRNTLIKINKPTDLFAWCTEKKKYDINIFFDPNASLTIKDLPENVKTIKVIVGPEAGFSKNEISKMIKIGFIPIKLGPRILRAETASIAVITALQTIFGDLK